MDGEKLGGEGAQTKLVCSDDDDDKRRKYAPSRLMCARLKLSRAQAKPSEIDIK